MKKFSAAVVLLSAFLTVLTFTKPASAISIFACNSTGDLKDTFYTNESVYVSGNVTGPEQDVDIYIVSHRASWPNGTSLTDISLGYSIITANSSGGIPLTILWPSPNAGNYDVVADVDRDGIYNSTYDVVDNVSTAGFTVLEAPKPTLTVILGSHHPESHECDLETESEHNVMMQINITASTKEDILLESLTITALGTGDDKEDIKVAYLIYDNNGNGRYDEGDVLLSYGTYTRDDGAIFFNINNGFEIQAGESKAFIITYTMSDKGSVNDTYRFDIITVTGRGKKSGDSAEINGLPLGSAIKTISHAVPPTLPLDEGAAGNETEINETIPINLTDECQTDADCVGVSCFNKKKTTYICVHSDVKGVNVCTENIIDVECCEDGDCMKGFYCLNNECVKESAGGIFGWLGVSGKATPGQQRNYIWTIISIVVVIVVVIVIFFVIKNRRRKPWKTEGMSEEGWESLRKKWGENQY